MRAPSPDDERHWALGSSEPAVAEIERRVLVWTPTGKDGALITTALQRSGMRAEKCRDASELVTLASAGVGVIVLAEEAVSRTSARQAIHGLIDGQPSWSDMPLVLLAKTAAKSTLAAEGIARLGNVTVLERPTQIATLVSAVATALRTRERQYLMRTAEQRKDAFLATLAHELRNPLAPLSNALHMLKRRDGALAQGSRNWALDIIERQSVQLTRLVDDLLDVARITQGKVTLQKQPVDIRDVIRNAAEISAPMIEAMQHRLALQLPPQPVVIHADAVRLAQCLSNLLNNAAKYTPHGGSIELLTDVADEAVRISVRDTGVGIPEHAISHVFEIFSQVDRSRANAQGGLGIGLSIVKTFVEMHGGRVEVHSDGEGRGSTFTMTIPRVSVPSTTRNATHDDPPPARSDQCCRVLIVDDNRDSADSLAELLSLHGHAVRVAYTGVDALDVGRAHAPHVAILDIGLPDMSGIEVGRRLRADPLTARTTLVALSGWGQAVDRQRSAEAGFEHHLIKPAELQRVIDILSRVDCAEDGVRVSRQTHA